MPPNNQQNQPPQQPYQPQPVQGGAPAPQYQAASQAHKDHKKLYLLLSVLFGVLFIGASVFGVWAFMERDEYKNETDAIVAREVEQAIEQNTTELEEEFQEREKEPLKTYNGPAAFGSLSIDYPKTWSAYVEESGSGRNPLEGYFHPGFVPDPDDNLIALKVEVVNQTYQQALRPFESAASRDLVTIRPLEAKNVDGVVGVRVDGEISRDVQGNVVLFELRDKTLILTTESTEFTADFNNIILENLSFNP